MKNKILILLLIVTVSVNLFANKIIIFDNINQKEPLKTGDDFTIVYGKNINPENTKVVIEPGTAKDMYYLRLVPFSKSDRDYETLFRKNIKSDSLSQYYSLEYDRIKDTMKIIEKRIAQKQPANRVDTAIINRINMVTDINQLRKPDLENMSNEELNKNYDNNLSSLKSINNKIRENRTHVNQNQELINLYKEKLIKLDNSPINKDEKNRLIALLDSLNNTNSYLSQQNELLQLDRKILEKDKKIFESEIKAQIKIRNYSIAIGIFFLLFLIYYFVNYRKKKKINLLLIEQKNTIESERKKSDDLLLNVLPDKIANRLKAGESPIADHFDEVTVVFIDISKFTDHSQDAVPQKVVLVLNQLYTIFDRIAEKYNLEKIKTIGDCYMAVAGLPEPNVDHAISAANFAVESLKVVEGFDTGDGTKLSFKIGIDCGPVVAGVIGEKKFIYDVWGDTVNTASRMEGYGVPGKIQVTSRFHDKILYENVNSFHFEEREELDIKGKGKMKTWFMTNGS